MRNVNQYTPDGSKTYSTNGGQQFTDPTTGASYFIPQYTETVSLSPEQQAIKAELDASKLNLGKLANNLSGQLGTRLTRNFTIDNESTERRLMELGRKRLDPVLAEQKAALDQRLANQGIRIGSKAYETATRQNSEAANDAYNQLLLSGRSQAVQEQLTEDNQRINQIGALMSGGQVSQPTFGQTNQPKLPTVDYAGLKQDEWQARMQIAQQKNAMTQSILGGLFGLGAAFISSDRRLKMDIKQIGTAANGLNIYSYRYVWGGPVQIGFMADEVEQLHPEAVIEVNGYKMVNYEKAAA